MVDIIANVGISLGAAAIYFIGNKNKWGFIVGLAAQPFWLYIAISTRQWGVFAVSVVFTANWAKGAYNWFVWDPRREAVSSGDSAGPSRSDGVGTVSAQPT